jgi:sec-independent protein translocase protein TatA
MFSGIGVPELLIVLVIALIVLGPKKLPEVGRSLGRGMREFKDSVSGITSSNDDEDEEENRELRAERAASQHEPR